MIGSGARAPFPILRTFYSAGRMQSKAGIGQFEPCEGYAKNSGKQSLAGPR